MNQFEGGKPEEEEPNVCPVNQFEGGKLEEEDSNVCHVNQFEGGYDSQMAVIKNPQQHELAVLSSDRSQK